MEHNHALISQLSDSASPEGLSPLQGQINNMDMCVERILKLAGEQGDAFSKKALIEKDENACSLTASTGSLELKKSELIAQVQELCQLHKSLSKRYVTSSNNPEQLSSVVLDSVDDDHEATFSTPEQRVLGTGPFKHSLQVPPSGSSSYNPSEGHSESLSWSPSSGYEAESYYMSTKQSSFPASNDGVESKPRYIWAKEEMNGFDSQEETVDSKHDPQKTVAPVDEERAKIAELEKTVTELEISLSDANRKNMELVEDLEVTREKLQVSEEQVASFERSLGQKIDEAIQQMQNEIDSATQNIGTLQAELDSQKKMNSELTEVISKYKNALADRDREAQDLMFALTAAHENLFKVKSSLESNMEILSSQYDILQERLEDAELRNRSVEEHLRKTELEKKETHDLHEAERECLLIQIEQLKAEVANKNEQVDVLNKALDVTKLKCDMLEAKKGEKTARVQALRAQVDHQAIEIKKKGDQLNQLVKEQEEFIAGAGSARKLINELRTRVAGLEEEVVQQGIVISERAEEKREVIRQLCLSLEYYRKEYHELRVYFPGHKQQAVMIS